jgi:hypothetical protein
MNLCQKLDALIVALVIVVASGGQGRAAEESSHDRETAAKQKTRQLVVEALGLRVGRNTRESLHNNYSGLTSETLFFTRRLDSRTYLAYDRRFSKTRELGMYRGPNKRLLQSARELLAKLSVPEAEIASATVLQEKLQDGRRDKTTRRIKLGKIVAGKKYAFVTRKVEGVPVFSSRAVVGLLAKGSIGFLEVHWPEIPPAAVAEARRYEEIVEKGWKAPSQPGTHVESVTAGIIHSPATGTAMDIVPMIRVIYAPDDKRVGRKPVFYLNQEGAQVAVPRIFLEPPKEELHAERPAAKER